MPQEPPQHGFAGPAPGVHGRLPSPRRRPRHRVGEAGVEVLGTGRPSGAEPPAQGVALLRRQVTRTLGQVPDQPRWRAGP